MAFWKGRSRPGSRAWRSSSGRQESARAGWLPSSSKRSIIVVLSSVGSRSSSTGPVGGATDADPGEPFVTADPGASSKVIAHEKKVPGEGGWVLENNKGLNRGMEALGGRIDKRYRVYERAL